MNNYIKLKRVFVGRMVGSLTEAVSRDAEREKELSQREQEIKWRIEKKLKKVKRVILVMSGKGGVGKSAVTTSLATTLALKRPNRVGVLDSDFHGPVIPMMLGVRDMKYESKMREGSYPVEGPLGIKVASMGLILPDETPFTLRGVMKYEVLREILCSVIWGELDYLLVDLPPGTSDDALNVAFALPRIDGAILVTIPTEVSRVPVRKCAVFCKQYELKMLGIIENMSVLYCPHCGRVIEIFGKGGKAEKIAREEGVPLLGKVPFDPQVAACMDEGIPFILEHPDSRFAKEFQKIAGEITRSLG